MDLGGVPPAPWAPFWPGFGPDVPPAHPLLASLEGLAVQLPPLQNKETMLSHDLPVLYGAGRILVEHRPLIKF